MYINIFISCTLYIFLLSTVIIKIQNVTNQIVLALALLHSGSDYSITMKLAYKLRMPQKTLNYNIVGVDQKTSQSNFTITARVKGRTKSYKDNVKFLTLQKITTNLLINVNKIDLPDYIQLANPLYSQPDNIDILIRVVFFYNILKREIFKPEKTV